MLGGRRPGAEPDRAEILHVDLRDPRGPWQAAHALYWVIFWWGDRPVGQYELSISVGATVDLPALAGRAVDADVLDDARTADQVPPREPTPNEKLSVVICTRDRPLEL